MILLATLLVGMALGWVISRFGRKHVVEEAVDNAVNIAHLDKLTGLPDRAIITDILQDAVDKQLPMTVAVCDVNGLKATNDDLGHVAGDQLLVAVSKRLLDLLPNGRGGVVARAGGDEFWIVTQATPQELVAAYTSNINGLAHSVAVGISSTPADGDPFRAIRCADVAMFHSKKLNTPVEIYDGTLGPPEVREDETLPSRERNRERRSGDDRRSGRRR